MYVLEMIEYIVFVLTEYEFPIKIMIIYSIIVKLPRRSLRDWVLIFCRQECRVPIPCVTLHWNGECCMEFSLHPKNKRVVLY